MRTVVGLYDQIENARQAVEALRNAGIQRDHISLVARDIEDEYKKYFERETGKDVKEGAIAGAGVGALLGGLAGLLVGLGTIILPGIGAILVGGPVLATLGGAAAGALAGGLLGALIDLGIPEEEAELYTEGVRRGGSLLVVRTTDEMAGQVSDIMDRFDPIDVEERAADWEGEGWEGFDEKARPYDRQQIETYRSRYRGTGMDTDVDATESERIARTGPYGGAEPETRERTWEPHAETTDSERIAHTGPYGGAEPETHRERRWGTGAGTMGAGVVRIYTTDMARERTGMRAGMSRESGTSRTGEQDWTSYEPEFRNHYEHTYSDTGRGYVYYRPAYLYGCNLASSSRYADYDWSRVEPEARRSWEERNGIGSWDEVTDAVRTSWNRCRVA